jgi:hypothetical protein
VIAAIAAASDLRVTHICGHFPTKKQHIKSSKKRTRHSLYKDLETEPSFVCAGGTDDGSAVSFLHRSQSSLELGLWVQTTKRKER